MKQPVDVFLSHDWPRNIARYGDQRALVSKKTFLKSEVGSADLIFRGGGGLLFISHVMYQDFGTSERS